MIDIHSHLLAGVDDGPQGNEMSLSMLKLAASAGTRVAVVTPHIIQFCYMHTWENIVERCRHLEQLAIQSGITVKLFPGAEVAADPSILDVIKGPGPYCINGGRYMLVELPMLDIPDYVNDFFFRLRMKGITPIIAHPERNMRVIKNPVIVDAWLEQGLLLQVNAGSINGLWGEKVRKTAKLLLHTNKVFCVASDAHNCYGRDPTLDRTFKLVERYMGATAAKRLFKINPEMIIGNLIAEQELTHSDPENKAKTQTNHLLC